MILKRLIAISVVLALAAGAVFAEISVSGQVIGTVNILEGDSQKGAKKGPDGSEFDADGNWLGTEGKPLRASAGMNRFRLEASGETDDGKFGAWLRAEGGDAALFGHAWWKPIDQLKVWIGSNGGDGFFGKEGVTGWMFYQKTSDTGVVTAGNVWGGGYHPGGLIFRDAFYAGGYDGGNAFYASISPIDVLSINIEVPFFDGVAYNADTNPKGLASSIFRQTIAQVDVKLDAANIALTYKGGLGYRRGIAGEDGTDFYLVSAGGTTAPTWTTTKPAATSTDVVLDTKNIGGIDDVDALENPGKFFLYGGIPVGDSLSIDIGVGFTLPVKDKGTTDENGDTEIQSWSYLPPVAAGLGVKFATGSFGIKARVAASFAGNYKAGEIKRGGFTTEYDKQTDPFKILFDVLPYYSVNDNLKILLSAGLGLTGKVDKEYKSRTNGVEADWEKIENDAVVGWHINPYVEIGQEWGPRFLAGVKIWSVGVPYKSSFDKNWTAPTPPTWTGTHSQDPKPDAYGYKKVINWAIPIAIDVSF